MKPASFCMLFGLAVCGWTHGSLAEESARVGSLGNPAYFAFEGVSIFRMEDIRSALQDDLDIFVAGHALKRRESFLRLIEQRVTEGYRTCGCPDAKVEARFDEARGQIVVRVDEGSRYTCGPIIVTGCRQASAEAVIAWLTKPKDDEQKTKPSSSAEGKPNVAATIQHTLSHPETSGVWRTDKSANVSDAGQNGLQAGIRDGFADQGFFSTKFTFETETLASGQPATLRIRVDDEGPVATLGQIKITGLKRHTEDEVLDFLKLHPGMPMKGLRANDLERRLEQSARFIKQSVTLTKREQAAETAGAASKKSYIFDSEVKPASGKQTSNKKNGEVDDEKQSKSESKSNTKVFKQLQDFGKEFTSSPQPTATVKMDLQIDVKEYLPAPKLNEPLSREDQTLQKVARWLETCPKGRDDLVAELTLGSVDPADKSMLDGAEIRLAAAAARGVVGWVHCQDSKGKTEANVGFVQSIDRLAIVRPTLPMRLDLNPRQLLGNDAQVGLKIDFKLIGANNPGESGDARMNLGFGFVQKDDVSPWTIGLKVDPVAAMDWGRGEGWKRSWEGDTFRMEKEAFRFVADARTGRVVECHVRSKSGITLRMRSGPGLFDEAMQQFDAEVRAIPNAFNDREPLRSVVEFAIPAITLFLEFGADARAARRPEEVAAVRVQAKLIGHAVSDAIQTAQKNFGRRDPSRPKFWIPLAAGTRPQAFFFLSPLALRLSRDVFAEETWPWSFSRATAFLVGGKSELASGKFKKLLESPGTGPVGCLTIAAAMNYLNPSARRMFAEDGLRRLNLRSFRRDYQALLHEDAPIGKAAVRYVELLRGMPPEDLRQLARYLADGQADSPIEQALLRLVQGKDQSPREALVKLLDELWEPVLMPKVKEWLETLAQAGEVRNVRLDRHSDEIANRR